MTKYDGNQMSAEGHETVCPLCERATAAVVVSQTPYSAIWGNLATEWGARFSESVISEHTPCLLARLLACTECGLEYFSPALQGSTSFYSELTSSSPNYYSEDKWEFSYVRRLLKPSDRLLDVACGKGAFIRSIAGRVGEAVGLDTNPVVLNKDGGDEIRIFNQTVEEFGQTHASYFDFVTAFQVIEHLNEVMPFVRAAYACVKPGGTLVLSVPNRERRSDQGFGSLDFPPHHLSRWKGDQLEGVARILGGRVAAIAREPMSASQVIGALRAKELPSLIPWPIPGRGIVFRVVSRLLLSFPMAIAWRTFGMNDRLGMYGMSLLAVIVKPHETPIETSGELNG